MGASIEAGNQSFTLCIRAIKNNRWSARRTYNFLIDIWHMSTHKNEPTGAVRIHFADKRSFCVEDDAC